MASEETTNTLVTITLRFGGFVGMGQANDVARRMVRDLEGKAPFPGSVVDVETVYDDRSGTLRRNVLRGAEVAHGAPVETTPPAAAGEPPEQVAARQEAATRRAKREGLEALTVPELVDRAREAGLENYSALRKSELVDALMAESLVP